MFQRDSSDVTPLGCRRTPKKLNGRSARKSDMRHHLLEVAVLWPSGLRKHKEYFLEALAMWIRMKSSLTVFFTTTCGRTASGWEMIKADKGQRFGYQTTGNGRWVSMNLKKKKKMGGQKKEKAKPAAAIAGVRLLPNITS